MKIEFLEIFCYKTMFVAKIFAFAENLAWGEKAMKNRRGGLERWPGGLPRLENTRENRIALLSKLQILRRG